MKVKEICKNLHLKKKDIKLALVVEKHEKKEKKSRKEKKIAKEKKNRVRRKSRKGANK